MPRYSAAADVAASPDDLFAYLTDFSNMPDYLPTVKSAKPQGEGRIEMTGQVQDQPYHSDGKFQVDEAARTMTWGSDGENKYSGRMAVTGEGDASRVEVHLNFEPRDDQDAEFEKRIGSRDAAINEGLTAAVQSIKNLVEGRGGKVPTRADAGGDAYAA